MCIKISVVWDVTPCSLVYGYEQFHLNPPLLSLSLSLSLSVAQQPKTDLGQLTVVVSG